MRVTPQAEQSELGKAQSGFIGRMLVIPIFSLLVLQLRIGMILFGALLIALVAGSISWRLLHWDE